MAVDHPNPVTVDDEYNGAWATARPYVEDDVQALAANQNALNEASQEVDARVTAVSDSLDALQTYVGGIKVNMKFEQSTVSPATDINITADLLGMSDNDTVVSSINVTADLGDAGAGGLDTGTVAVDTFYHIFVIHDTSGTSTPVTTGLASTSTAPTMPTGYDVYRRVGQVLTDSNGDMCDFIHIPDIDEVILLSAEDAGTTAEIDIEGPGLNSSNWTDIDLSAMQPAGVARIKVRFYGVSGTPTTSPLSCRLYARPTWGTDISAGTSLSRRLFEVVAPGDSGSANTSVAGLSGDFWLHLDGDGKYSFREGTDAWGSLDAFLVGWKLSL